MSDTRNEFSLVKCMQEVPDPRAPYNQKHKFMDIIIIAVTGKIQGVVAIDGKTVRRSRDAAKEKQPAHVVSAWAPRKRLRNSLCKVKFSKNRDMRLP